MHMMFRRAYGSERDITGGGGGEEETVIEHKMCVVIFSTTFIRNVSCFKKHSARCNHKCTHVFM
jgi:hypothetical protein